MAVVLQILNDGPRNHVVHVDIAGANTAATIVDASAWSGPLTKCKLKKAAWSFVGTTANAQILWDATSDLDLLDMANSDTQDFSDVGGLLNNAGTGVTGDVLITNAAGLTNGSCTLWFQKY